MFKVIEVGVAERLSPVSFSLQPGEVRLVTGKSGSGKSVLLRALADLDPHNGAVSLDEMQQSKTAAPLWRQNVMWFSAETAWWLDTVGEHFKPLPSKNAKTAENNAKNHQVWLNLSLKSLHLELDILQKLCRECSSGEKQRLALLRGLSVKPRVLLLDEITANLDDETAQAVEAFVLDYVQQHQACALWVSHDMTQQARLAGFSTELPLQLFKP